MSLFNVKPLAISTFVALLVVFGCSEAGPKKLGQAIPDSAAIVTLAAIQKAPADYNGKMVVLKGIISGQCPSLCEFTYKEGTRSTLIFPQGFKFPKLPKGKPVTVYAEITSGPGSVAVSALGLRLE